MEKGGETVDSTGGPSYAVGSSCRSSDRGTEPSAVLEDNRQPRRQRQRFRQQQQWSHQRPPWQQPRQQQQHEWQLQREQQLPEQRSRHHEQFYDATKQPSGQPQQQRRERQRFEERRSANEHGQPRDWPLLDLGESPRLPHQSPPVHVDSVVVGGSMPPLLHGVSAASGGARLPNPRSDVPNALGTRNSQENFAGATVRRYVDQSAERSTSDDHVAQRRTFAGGSKRGGRTGYKSETFVRQYTDETLENSAGATVRRCVDQSAERSTSADHEAQPRHYVKTFSGGSKRGGRTGHKSETFVRQYTDETLENSNAMLQSSDGPRTPIRHDRYQALEFSATQNVNPRNGRPRPRGDDDGSKLISPMQLTHTANGNDAALVPPCAGSATDGSDVDGNSMAATFEQHSARPRQPDRMSGSRIQSEANVDPARRGYSAAREWHQHGGGRRSQNAFSSTAAVEVSRLQGSGSDRLANVSASSKDKQVHYGAAGTRDDTEPSSSAFGGRERAGPRAAPSSGSFLSGAYAGAKFDRGIRWQQRAARNETSSAEASECQLEMLVNQLWSNSLECMICCCTVRVDVAVWSCESCYHVFHLYCIKKWANAATAAAATGSHSNATWQCPACRVPHSSVPAHYDCFCGRLRDPPVNPRELPHSCGEVCHKKRKCPHACTRLCHPGPCPPCRAQSRQSCDCGKMQVTRNCNAPVPLKCDVTCGKSRSCGRHVCTETCHRGACEPCAEQLEQVCHCPRSMTRLVPCISVDPNAAVDMLAEFSCGLTCGRLLECGVHKCGELCHSGSCPPCSRLPAAVTHCPCGRRQLVDLGAKQRTACTDPVPSCGAPCRKRLPCYSETDGKGEKHICRELCHDGACSPCQDETTLRCRCGSELSTVKCASLISDDGSYTMSEFTCSRRCNAKMSCGRHRCSRLCCPRNAEDGEEVHMCLQVCGRQLSCGVHRCDDLCHRGPCRPCPHASFDELRCHCGAEVIFPPVPCSTAPPNCDRPCQRQHSCSHPVTHNCHPDTEQCPRCVELTEKWCMGQHELRTSIPCYLAEVSCGRSCGKPLPCGVHCCVRACHKGDCSIDGKPCNQSCTRPRADCGHACGAPCHGAEPCPTSAPCLALVQLKCVCGVRSGNVPCGSCSPVTGRFARTSAGMFAVKLSEASRGKTVNLEDEVFSLPEQDQSSSTSERARRRLKCDEQCAIVERNRRLALALEIENPDLQAKLGVPAYSDFLRSFARREPAFVMQVEKSLSALVMNSKQEKQQSPWLTYSFLPMKSERRRVIHELAVFYGCTTQSQDQEPNKSVVVSALKHKCWLPSVLLSVAVQKNIVPKPPLPIPHDAVDEEAVKARAKAAKSSLHGVAPSDRDIDYFDITE